MSSPSLIEELNEAIDLLVAHPDAAQCVTDEVSELMDVARELRYLPRAEFKARLKADLQEQALAIPSATSPFPITKPIQHSSGTKDGDCDLAILPTLLGYGYGNYPVRRAGVAASFLLHAAAAALIVSSSLWVAQLREKPQQHVISLLAEPSPYALPVAPGKVGGGGGGGDRDRLPASKGTPPRFAREQLNPPAIVIRNPEPKLPAEATVVGPPQLTFPQIGPTGDRLATVLGPPSNGTGSGGGIGSGSGGGIGSGRGPGVGPGYGGGIGGGVYRVGGGVSAPRAIYDPDPEYSEEARKAKHQGTVVLSVIIGPDGRPKDLRVQRSLGMGLDEKAIEAVRKWRFEPAMKNGQPVAVQVNIEVNFRLY
jgi:periplasmic protein TonB